MTNTPTPNTSATELRNLSTALTFHASFDQGPNADFALGDNQLYTAKIEQDTDDLELSPGITDPSLSIVKGEGKYGDALAFTRPSDKFLSYKAEKNVTYSHEKFQGTASFWMRLDPAEIGGQYADPFQLTDKNFSDDCIWIDFTKNDTPSDFRMGVFGDRNEWDTKKLRANSQEFFWRLAKITEPPFAKDRWTHVAITWDGLNDTKQGRARLYFNAEYRESSGIIREHFNWDTTKATIRLGTGPFVGLIDDLAFFNRPLTAAEIRVLYQLEGGVAALHP